MTLDDIELEDSDTENIKRLTEEFGNHDHNKIKELYVKVKKKLHESPKIIDYIPLLVYKEVRDILSN